MIPLLVYVNLLMYHRFFMSSQRRACGYLVRSLPTNAIQILVHDGFIKLFLICLY